MTWTPYNSQGFESAKIWHLVVPYAYGRGLDIGCGHQKCLPHMIGVDSGKDGCHPDIKAEAGDLDLFADGSLDFIFSSHLLEHIEPENVLGLLACWHRKLKVGGHMILYLPNSDDYPWVGKEGSNPDHKWDVRPGGVADVMDHHHACGWIQVEDEVRSAGNEYSLFEVYRKTDGMGVRKQLWQRNPFPLTGPLVKRAIVMRYGAIGDTLIAASVLPGLAKLGYYITFHTNEVGEELLRHHPLVDEIIVQNTDMVPGHMLRDYWMSFEREGRYDLVVNLNHSLEGICLSHDDFVSQFWSHEARRKHFGGMNYLEAAHDIAGVTYHFEPTFHATAEEQTWAAEGRAKIDGPVVLWQIAGSAMNKVYPYVDTVTKWLVEDGIVVIFTGGKGNDERLENAVMQTLFHDKVDTEQIAPRCGKWTIRQSIAMAREVDCVVGPETGLMNGVALDQVPKVIYLSHSNPNNLTRHWINTDVIMPSTAASCPCYPCHMIHKDWSTCHEVEETKAALCASEIRPVWVYEAIKRLLIANAQVARAAE